MRPSLATRRPAEWQGKPAFPSHFFDNFTHTHRVAVEMIRIFQHGDHAAIAEIFTGAVLEIASEVYSSEQCLAWSSREVNYEHWEKRCELIAVGTSIAGCPPHRSRRA
jgi:hypothetical protein